MKVKYPVVLVVLLQLYVFLFFGLTGTAYSQETFRQRKEIQSAVRNNIQHQNYLASQEIKLKSKSLAVVYAFGATAGLIAAPFLLNLDGPTPALFVIPGIIVGPSTGNMYAHNWKDALNGSLIRIGAGALFVTGGLMAWDNESGFAGVFLISAIVIMSFSVIYDIFFSSPRSVDEYNQRIREKSSISVNPWISPGGNGGGLKLHLDL
jgi:hypothetical protein